MDDLGVKPTILGTPYMTLETLVFQKPILFLRCCDWCSGGYTGCMYTKSILVMYKTYLCFSTILDKA